MSDFDAIRALTGHDKRVSVERLYIDAMNGDLLGGMFLSELIFWCDKGSRSDGWFYRTAQEWEERAYLTRYQVAKYTKMCEEWGWLETSVMKANGAPTVHYRIDPANFSKWILKFCKIHFEKLQNESANFSESLTDTTTSSSLSLPPATPEEPQPPAEPVREDPRIILSDPVQGPRPTVPALAGLDPRRIVAGHFPPGQGKTGYEVFREIFDYIPGRTVIQEMNRAVGKEPSALQRWRETLTAYALSGKPPNWVKAQLDWYRDGIPAAWDPKQKGTPNGNHYANPTAPARNGGKPSSHGRTNGLGLSVLDLPQSEQDRIKGLLAGVRPAARAPG